MVGCTAASHDMATVVKSHSWMHIATNKACLAHELRITLESLVQSVVMADKLHKWCCSSFFKLLWHFLPFVFTVLLTHLRSRYRANSHLNVGVHRSYLVALGAALHLWQQLFTVYWHTEFTQGLFTFQKINYNVLAWFCCNQTNWYSCQPVRVCVWFQDDNKIRLQSFVTFGWKSVCRQKTNLWVCVKMQEFKSLH